MIRIGKIVATHGINGALVMTHVVGTSKWLKKDTTLMVEMQKGSLIPYFTTQVKAVNDKEYLISVEDIEKVEAAKKYYKDEIEQTQKQLNNLQNNPATIEKYARERYLLKREGEEVYLFQDTASTQAAAADKK